MAEPFEDPSELSRSADSRSAGFALPGPPRVRPVTFGIVEETAEYLVVNKPPFLQVHPSKPGDERTLWHGLQELLAFELLNGGQISLINRLDRETSGLMLVAKTRAAARRFGLLMQERAFRKTYLAVVRGWPAREEWEVEAPLLRQGERQESAIYLKQMVHAEGAPARTAFRVRERFRSGQGAECALVEARPETGRLHQIRVHLAHSGHWILGDKIYGPDERCYLEFIETGWTPALEERLLHPRHALHASGLEVPGPGPWRAELPEDLRMLCGAGRGEQGRGAGGGPREAEQGEGERR